MWFSNMRFEEKLTCTCREIDIYFFLVPSRGLAHILLDDQTFLVIGIVIVTMIRKLWEYTVHCLAKQGY
jgi:hypothetical protein